MFLLRLANFLKYHIALFNTATFFIWPPKLTSSTCYFCRLAVSCIWLDRVRKSCGESFVRFGIEVLQILIEILLEVSVTPWTSTCFNVTFMSIMSKELDSYYTYKTESQKCYIFFPLAARWGTQNRGAGFPGTNTPRTFVQNILQQKHLSHLAINTKGNEW
jgi:hypothetical protein